MNARGSVVSAFDDAGCERVWNVSNSECQTISRKVVESNGESLVPSYSASRADAYFWGNELVAHDHDGKEIVVGTCADQVVRKGNRFLWRNSKSGILR